MKKIVTFYVENGLWYADLPEYIAQGGTKEDCQMVAGADIFLDIISDCADEITLILSDEPFQGARQLTLQHLNLDNPQEGATYVADNSLDMWLCPVTLFVFNHYPPIIYFK